MLLALRRHLRSIPNGWRVCLQSVWSCFECIGWVLGLKIEIIRKNRLWYTSLEVCSAKCKGKGKCIPNLTTKNSKSKFSDFPKLDPERLWGIAGHVGAVGRAETCSKPAPCGPPFPHAWRCATVASQWKGKGSQKLTTRFSKARKFDFIKLPKFRIQKRLLFSQLGRV